MEIPKQRWFILDEEHHVVAASGIKSWARWLSGDDKKRRVDYTELADGIVTVSTIFLGLDHNYYGKGPPILFETIVFGLTMESGEMQRRYSSWDDAEVGHKMTVKKVKAMIAKASAPKVTNRRDR